ncbi:hypothetical protein Y11_02731 [Yersinia enterocolitica subsp. palearctica Y11]|uniref:Uncharacterized protein n=1 Tax=Yersinia enterocolitica subsp. palearctica serotype O:3 (strain DSM 13030 / CIP 106945 / Y11) TaxID=930944 RepID=A0A0H3P043_YERE1|nr:hypothetical protein Y11_02731 [Yersinia enterocolitica subsp. palearctica Y11]CCO67419.1 hypothetical protein D322_523 [Yersinia enterocolitica IP 10393]
MKLYLLAIISFCKYTRHYKYTELSIFQAIKKPVKDRP